MMKEKLPEAIYEGELKLCGLKLRTYILDNGQRVIDSNDLEDFWLLLQNGDFWISEEEYIELAKFIQGN